MTNILKTAKTTVCLVSLLLVVGTLGCEKKTDVVETDVMETDVMETDVVEADVVPKLISPTEGEIMDNGRSDRQDDIVWDFEWSDVPGATEYHLYVIGKIATIPVIDQQHISLSFYQDARQGSYIIGSNRFGWSWKVRARIEGQWGDWAAERFFDVEPMNTDKVK